MNKTIFIIMCSLLGFGCVSTPQPQQDLPLYLNQFIGQSVNTLKSELNFKQFGYTNTSKPVMTSNGILVYRIQRALAIPIPTFTGASNGPYGSTAPTTGSFSESYNVNLNCDIRFHLNNNQVTQWSYSGKAC